MAASATITRIQGTIPNGSPDSGNPVKTGGVYNSSAPTLSNGQRGDTQVDVNGNTKTTLATLLAGEDLTNNRIVVEQRFSYANITTNATTTVKSSAGFLHCLTINTHGSAGNTVAIYDSLSGTGTKIGTVDCNSGDGKLYDISFLTGLTVVTSTGTPADLTLSFR